MPQFFLTFFVLFYSFSFFELEASLTIGQFDDRDETENSVQFSVRQTLNNMITIAHEQSKLLTMSEEKSSDEEDSDSSSSVQSCSKLVPAVKKINTYFNRAADQIEMDYPALYTKKFLTETLKKELRILPGLVFYEYFLWISEAQEHLENMDYTSGSGFAIIINEQRRIAACKFSSDPRNLVGRRTSGPKRRIDYEHACAAIYHKLGLSAFVHNALTSDYLIEQYFDSGLYDIEPEKEAPEANASKRRSRKVHPTYKKLVKEFRKYQDTYETQKKEDGQFADKKIVRLKDMLCFLDKNTKFRETFENTLDSENISDLMAIWYVGYQRDMHGSNILLKFTDSGKIYMHGFDFEHSLEERFAPLGARCVTEVRAPEFLRISAVQRMEFSKTVIEKLGTANTEDITAIITRIIPRFATALPNELTNIIQRISRLNEFASSSRNSTLLKLYNSLTDESVHPAPSTKMTFGQAWPEIRRDDWVR